MTQITPRPQCTRATGETEYLKEKVDLLDINKQKRELSYLMGTGMKKETSSKEK